MAINAHMRSLKILEAGDTTTCVRWADQPNSYFALRLLLVARLRRAKNPVGFREDRCSLREAWYIWDPYAIGNI